jgi:hypothetical protein
LIGASTGKNFPLKKPFSESAISIPCDGAFSFGQQTGAAADHAQANFLSDDKIPQKKLT